LNPSFYFWEQLEMKLSSQRVQSISAMWHAILKTDRKLI